jgi:hypothetical protein
MRDPASVQERSHGGEGDSGCGSWSRERGPDAEGRRFRSGWAAPELAGASADGGAGGPVDQVGDHVRLGDGDSV